MTIDIRRYASAFPDPVFDERSEVVLGIIVASGPDVLSKVARRDLAAALHCIDGDDRIRDVLLRGADENAATSNKDHLVQMKGAEPTLDIALGNLEFLEILQMGFMDTAYPYDCLNLVYRLLPWASDYPFIRTTGCE